MNTDVKVLFLTSISPFPIRGGEKLRSYALLKMLSNIGAKVTAIINDSKNIPEIPNIRFIEFPFDQYQSKHLHAYLLSIIIKNKHLSILLDNLTSREKYDVAIIDYHYYGQYIQFFKNKGLKVIYGTHNAQAKLYFQRKATGIKSFIRIVSEYIVETIHERFYFQKADAFLVVSAEDHQFYSNFINPRKIVLMPNMIEKPAIDNGGNIKENYIIMTANFLAFQNSIGLDWFLKEVWNKELSEKTSLRLYGIGSDKVFNELNQQYHPSNVEALGEVDDIKPFIAKARASIVPLLNGSGTRLKCLEAMSLRTQLISTSKGSEGIDHDGSVIIADTSDDFRNRIIDVLDNKINTVEDAYQVFEKKYSFENNQIVLSDLIKRIISQTEDH
jgi:hypothetical protein